MKITTKNFINNKNFFEFFDSENIKEENVLESKIQVFYETGEENVSPLKVLIDNELLTPISIIKSKFVFQLLDENIILKSNLAQNFLSFETIKTQIALDLASFLQKTSISVFVNILNYNFGNFAVKITNLPFRDFFLKIFLRKLNFSRRKYKLIRNNIFVSMRRNQFLHVSEILFFFKFFGLNIISVQQFKSTLGLCRTLKIFIVSEFERKRT